MLRARTQTKLLLLGAGGILLAIAVGTVFSPQAILVERWQQELEGIPDEEVRVRLEQIAAVGDHGVPVLIDALHSQRQVIAEVAYELLNRYLDEQELLSAEESSPRIAVLASELGQQCKRRGAFAADANVQLATRLLLWPTVRSGIDNEQLVADCEVVIRTFAVDKAKPTSRAAADVVPVQFRQLQAPTIVSADYIDLPGGGVMAELAELSDLAKLSELPRAESDLDGGGVGAPDVIESPSFHPVATRSIIGQAAESWQDLPSQTPLDNALPLPSAGSGIVLRRNDWKPPAPQQQAGLDGLAARSDLEVMQQLASTSRHAVQTAVDELTRRGFRSREMRLAERLVNPDPAVRLELAESLPQLAGIDSRPWLMWLCSDPEAIVRRAAISIIATGNDPALFDHLRQIERSETDDEVLRLLRSVLARR